MARRLRVAIVGMGSVAQAFLELLATKAELLRRKHDLEIVVTGVADSRGSCLDAHGMDGLALLAHKRSGASAGAFEGGVPGMTAVEMANTVTADCLVAASAVNLASGQPGLECAQIAMRRGMGVVLADKGPLVHAFAELEQAAQAQGVGLAFSATVCGALPVVNIGQRDLVACEISLVRGIFNSTSNSILEAMRSGGTYEQALRQAQLDGIAEADPSLDVGGWDTANKLVIIANSILGQRATLPDVQPVIGITEITPAEIAARGRQGEVVKLVATARRAGERYQMSVQPEWLPAGTYLANVSGWEMGVVFETDIMGLQQFKVDERGPLPTAAAVLRDLVNMAGQRSEIRQGGDA